MFTDLKNMFSEPSNTLEERKKLKKMQIRKPRVDMGMENTIARNEEKMFGSNFDPKLIKGNTMLF